MSTKARVVLTVAAGTVTGVLFGLRVEGTLDLYALVVLLPLIVGRWWVVAALAGPFVAGLALQLTGHVVVEDPGSDHFHYGFAFFVFSLAFLGFLMLIFVGIRKGFDFIRRSRLTATS